MTFRTLLLLLTLSLPLPLFCSDAASSSNAAAAASNGATSGADSDESFDSDDENLYDNNPTYRAIYDTYNDIFDAIERYKDSVSSVADAQEAYDYVVANRAQLIKVAGKIKHSECSDISYLGMDIAKLFVKITELLPGKPEAYTFVTSLLKHPGVRKVSSSCRADDVLCNLVRIAARSGTAFLQLLEDFTFLAKTEDHDRQYYGCDGLDPGSWELLLTRTNSPEMIIAVWELYKNRIPDEKNWKKLQDSESYTSTLYTNGAAILTKLINSRLAQEMIPYIRDALATLEAFRKKYSIGVDASETEDEQLNVCKARDEVYLAAHRLGLTDVRKESLSHAAAASSDDSGKATADPSSLGAPAKAPKRSRDECDDDAEDDVELDAIDQDPASGAGPDADDSDADCEAPLKRRKN